MIVSVGSINADFVVKVDGPGTQLARDLLRTSGGKASNVAVLAARLGAAARLCGAVGDDDLAAQALAGPVAAGVDIGCVQRAPGPTAYSSVTVPPDGRKTIVLALNANDRYGGGILDDVPTGSVVVVDLEIPADVATATVIQARSAGLLTVVDPAPPERADDALLRAADHLTPDHHEASSLTGVDASSIDGAWEAARVLRSASGAGIVHVKLADGGSVVASADGCWTVTAPAVDVVDATGAGDAYTGALAWALHSGLPVPDAARVAVAASTIAVTGFGSQEAYPANRAELDAMVARVSVEVRAA